jgi:hypothetical protein
MDCAVHAHDGAETLGAGIVFAAEEFKLVHALEVPDQGALGTIDFDAIIIFATRCDASGFKRRNRSVGETRQEQEGVINVDVDGLA